MASASSGSTTDWAGMFKPARQLTEDELELLTPVCRDCNMDAIVVEAQYPLDDYMMCQSLFEFEEGALRFFCANHSPIEVDDEASDALDISFYEKYSVEMRCPINGGRIAMCTCIQSLPPCIDGCTPIRVRLGDLRPAAASIILTRGRTAYEAKYPGHFSPLHKNVLEQYKRAGVPFSELRGIRTTPPYLREQEAEIDEDDDA